MRTKNSLRFFAKLFTIPLILTMWGCATNSEKASPQEPVAAPVLQVLRPGTMQTFAAPLPALTPYFVDTVQGNDVLASRLAFRAWDFDHDGRTDYLEVLSQDGTVQERLYDFDRDGKVDLTRRLKLTEQSP